jgi:hypothetical protein
MGFRIRILGCRRGRGTGLADDGHALSSPSAADQLILAIVCQVLSVVRGGRPIRFERWGSRCAWLRSAMPGCFLDKLDAGGESEFGVDMGEVGLHGAG